MIDAFRGIEITKLYVFGTRFPDPNEYTAHIRPFPSLPSSPPVSINCDMGWYMNQGGGRFAYPSLFPIVSRFFQDERLIPSGTYNYVEMVNILGINPVRSSEVDIF